VSATHAIRRPRGRPQIAVPLRVEPYSEHGQRVEAALAELDRITDRLEEAIASIEAPEAPEAPA
jgi:hypothetical protein